jgi:hypothetical protein
MRPARIAAAALALVVLVPACGEDEGGKDASGQGKSVAGPVKACASLPTLPTEQGAALLPKGLSLPGDVVVLQAETQAVQTIVSGATSTGVSDLRKQYEAQVRAAGYAVTKTDDEGREAEVYFTVDGKAAVVGITRSTCPPAPTRFSVSVRR